MQTVTRFVIRHRWWVIVAWVLFIVSMQGLASAAGGSAYKDVFTLPGTETQKVLDLLRANGQGGQTGQVGTVVIRAASGALDANRAPEGLQSTLQSLCGAGLHVASATSPWGVVDCAAPVTPAGGAAASDPRTAGRLSADTRTALVTIAWEGNQNDVANFPGASDRLHPRATDTVRYEFTGDAFANLSAKPTGVPPEVFGFLAALVILAVIFGTFGATVLPLLSAAAALGSGLGLIALLSHAMNVASFSTQLAELMVIGVGVDYALFIVTRHRRNVRAGMSVPDSIVLAVNTSGRAVLFAGATVCVAILGLAALGVSFLYGVAVGTAIAVSLTMVASLTLLPALLSLLGKRILPRSQRGPLPSDRLVKILLCVIPPVCFVFWVLYPLQALLRPVTRSLAAHRSHRTGPGFWVRWSSFVEGHKLVLGTIAGGLIAVLAIPFFSMRLGHADQANDPAHTTTRKGYDLISREFGTGYNSTLELVVDGPAAADPGYLKTVAARLAGAKNVDPATVRPVPLGQDLALVTFTATTSPQDPRTTALVKDLRRDLVPPLEQGTPNQIYVFGQTAVFVDFTKVLASKMPLFFTAVIGLSFLLLMVAFRSLLIPLTAAVMNLFAAAASFGVVVAIFQWGWFSEALGIGSGGPIEAFLPVIFFAILFGLSMDYQVFLVSRMHEEWIHTGDNARSVRVGQAETGGIITAAALIMIAVFGGFLLGDARVIKLVGVGLGGAIFLDAFVLRTVLVPALMHAFGRANWYFPAWLDRVTPHLSVEPADDGWTPGSDDEPEPELSRV